MHGIHKLLFSACVGFITAPSLVFIIETLGIYFEYNTFPVQVPQLSKL